MPPPAFWKATLLSQRRQWLRHQYKDYRRSSTTPYVNKKVIGPVTECCELTYQRVQFCVIIGKVGFCELGILSEISTSRH
ncbi:unnamed protein product [Leptosia nina]|uniref:Ribosomal protein S14 n=1 Tax=Leptosia nina TaxID=320188 RepID=A0AAV1JG37_9NEOP